MAATINSPQTAQLSPTFCRGLLDSLGVLARLGTLCARKMTPEATPIAIKMLVATLRATSTYSTWPKRPNRSISPEPRRAAAFACASAMLPIVKLATAKTKDVIPIAAVMGCA